MEDYLHYKTFRIQEKITKEKVNELHSKSDDMQGIEKVNCAGQVISFIYNPYAISERQIIECLSSFGFTVKMRNPKSFKSRLARLAHNNNENLGGKRLDCCDLIN